jgi:branched-chain amino acid transport system permease protein
VLGGKKNFWTPIIGAALFEVIPNVVSLSDDVKWLIFGAVMVLAVTVLPDGIGGAVARLYRRIRGRPDRSDEQLAEWTRAAVTGPTTGIDRPIALAVHGVGKDYGGVRALDEVSFHLDSGGEVLGLIGPNGSGKTTMFNVISGFVRPDRGSVELSGTDISKLPPERIAGLGLVRTFQEEAAFPTLTVGECEQVARAAGGSDGVFSLARNAIRTKSGTDPVTRTTVGELSHGGQRLLAIALAFASAPSVILLDEPAAGLGPDEADAVAAMIRLASGHGVSVVLIEHHMEMVMDVCHRVVVLGSGRQLATGTPAEVTSDAAVVDAYLGSFGREAAARPRQEVETG